MRDIERLQHQIREALAHDGHVQNPRIRVTFFDDAVALAGEVRDARAKLRAEEIVHELAPDHRVDNALVITSNRPLSDAELYSRAQVLLARHPGIPESLGVQIYAGRAHLVGEAPDQATLETAAKLISQLNGIVSVDCDQVRIPHRETVSDEVVMAISETDLANRFAGLLQHEPDLYERVFADFEQQRVTLTGWVTSEPSKLRAEAIAFGLPGVREVINRIEVQGD